MLDSPVGPYSPLDPPQELQECHPDRLGIAETPCDHARTRPSENSFIEEFSSVAFEMMGAAMETGLDKAMTEEKKKRLMEEKTGDFPRILRPRFRLGASGRRGGPECAARGDAGPSRLLSQHPRSGRR